MLPFRRNINSFRNVAFFVCACFEIGLGFFVVELKVYDAVIRRLVPYYYLYLLPITTCTCLLLLVPASH